LAIKTDTCLFPEIERAFAIHPTSLRAVARPLLTETSKIAMLQTSYQNQLAWLGSVKSAMFAAAFAGRQTITTNESDEPGYLPMEDGRVINPIDRGPALPMINNKPLIVAAIIGRRGCDLPEACI
jgi:hypothetical protein